MLAELGVRFLDHEGLCHRDNAEGARGACSRGDSGLDPRLDGLRIEVACDVDNPLVGEHGASAVFGPQKGVGSQDVDYLDAMLSRWADVSGHAELAEVPGAGAAGGLGFAPHPPS